LSQPTAAAGRCMMVSHASRLRGFARLFQAKRPHIASCQGRSSTEDELCGESDWNSCAARGCWRRSRCARLTGTIGKELGKVKVCEPSCHRAGRSRARASSLSGKPIQTIGRGNVPIASPRDESSCADSFAFLRSRGSRLFASQRPDACAVTYLRAQSTGHGRRRACEASLATSPGGQL